MSEQTVSGDQEPTDVTVCVTGCLHGGITFVGPCIDADDTLLKAVEEYDDDWGTGVSRLYPEVPGAPSLTPLEAPYGYDPAGTAVVFSGDVTKPWVLYGPFKDLEAARRWAAADGRPTNCVIELKPVPPLAAEAA